MKRETGNAKPHKPPEGFDQWMIRAQRGLKILNASLRRKLTKGEQAILNSFVKSDTGRKKRKVVALKPGELDAKIAAMNASIDRFAESVQAFVDSRKEGSNGNGRKRKRLP